MGKNKYIMLLKAFLKVIVDRRNKKELKPNPVFPQYTQEKKNEDFKTTIIKIYESDKSQSSYENREPISIHKVTTKPANVSEVKIG